MSQESALALASYLAATPLPQGDDDEAMDRHMRAAFARWPDLTDAEIKWAIERAAAISRREGNRATAEAKAIEAAIGGGEQT